jgi:hypothetical protein
LRARRGGCYLRSTSKGGDRQMRMTFLVITQTLGTAERFAYLPATPA